MEKKEVIRFLIFRTLGNFLILLTIFGFFATFGPAVYYEAQYRITKAVGVRFRVVGEGATASELGKILEKYRGQGATGAPSLLGSALSNNKEQVLIPKSTGFSIVIPKIGANEKVIENVDPSNKQEYLEALKNGVAHAKGSAFPGMGGNIYLFAHSADNFWDVGRYNAVFYLLKELESGDEVVIFFQDKRYTYVVYDKQIVDPEKVDVINANLGGGEILTLQTCWPPGTTWKRLLVFAKPK